MSKNNCFIRCSVGSTIFLQMLVGCVLLLVTFTPRSEDDSHHKNLVTLKYCLLTSAILLITSSSLLLCGAMWSQPKYLLAHLGTDIVIIVLTIIFIGIATYNNDGDPEVVLSMGFALAIPIGVMCALDYGVYRCYRRMIDETRRRDNTYELCNIDTNQ